MAKFAFSEQTEKPDYFVPAGEYIIGVDSAEMGLSRAGDDMLIVVFRVLADTKETELPNANGIRIWDRIVLAKAAWRVNAMMMGIHNPQRGEIDINNAWLTSELIGRCGWAKLIVVDDEYKGKKVKKNEIERWVMGRPDPNPKWAQAKDETPF